ncbi:hypothetical protein L1049_001162 [Liquidambar formosana]|uniref:Pectinesterase inhibitor domain-containing protein n=1 Tax=Liquidambar formosana TaxID=63359 RepID=A0AAP0NE72_LIQFO
MSLMTIFLLISQFSILADEDNLIDKTCKQTPFYDLCVATLQNDSRSASANVSGLGGIMVDAVSVKATELLDHIQELLKRTTDPMVKQSLKECANIYHVVRDADVPQAAQAFAYGDYKFAEQAMNDAANEADICQRKFMRSPLTDWNKNEHDLATVAASIAKLLLEGI